MKKDIHPDYNYVVFNGFVHRAYVPYALDQNIGGNH